MTEVQQNIQDEQDQIRQRREKLTALREETIVFPTDFRRDVVTG
jgi:lysyl-tRNA synthetase, class II